MRPEKILESLQEIGVSVHIEKGDLVFRGNLRSLREEYREVLRQNKPSLLAYMETLSEIDRLLHPFARLIAFAEQNALPVPETPYFVGPNRYCIDDPNEYVRCAVTDVHRCFGVWRNYDWRDAELQERIAFLTFLREQLITNPKELSQA